MTLSRYGTGNIYKIDGLRLETGPIPEARVGFLAKISPDVTQEGQRPEVEGTIISISKDKTVILMSDYLPADVSTENMAAWLLTNPHEIIDKPSLSFENRIFRTGILPIDLLCPLRESGAHIIQTSFEHRLELLKLIASKCVDSSITPITIGIDVPQTEQQAIKSTYAELGIEGMACLSGRDQNLSGRKFPLLEASKVARSLEPGQKALLIVFDPSAWNSMWNEEQALSLHYRSHTGGDVAFKRDLLYHISNISHNITTILMSGDDHTTKNLASVAESQIHFDHNFAMTLTSHSKLPSNWLDSCSFIKFQNLLIKQTKSLWLQAENLQNARSRGFTLDEASQKILEFHQHLTKILKSKDDAPLALASKELWKALSILDEDQIDKIPLPILREHVHR